MDSASPIYLQIAIVVFREVLEISLILGILASATKNVVGRGKWILGGLMTGSLFSLLLAMSTDAISSSLNGMGQELFNGLVMIAAASMIGWTVIWMQKQGRVISGELKQLGKNVQEGSRPLYSLALVVMLSVLREGAEIALFCYSYYVSGTNLTNIIFGLLVGILSGAAFGFALYLGLLKSFGRYFFAITSWLLIFFAAGTFAAGIRFLSAAELINPLADPLFDLSEILPQNSLIGKMFHLLFGYVDRPSGAEFITYFLVLAVLAACLRITKNSSVGSKTANLNQK